MRYSLQVSGPFAPLEALRGPSVQFHPDPCRASLQEGPKGRDSFARRERKVHVSLAEGEEVKDNEDGLEGWTAYQLLSKVSENATQGFEILTQAVDDIISHLSSRNSRVVRIRSSNLTKWRPETQKWLQNQSDDVVLVQETHLSTQRVADAVIGHA